METNTAATAFVYHPDFELHDTGLFHPETANRAKTVFERIRVSDFAQRLTWLTPEKAATHWIEKCHHPDYVRFVEDSCLQGQTLLDAGDTRSCPESYRVALLATGGALLAVDSVVEGRSRNAFSCSRPPGHHARPADAMGFCLFDHIAVAARYAQQKHGLKRILIIDWDVHHGNGTEEIFYEDPSVFYFSIHQYPYYPGTGAANDTGKGEGEGYTLNVPLTTGCGMREYREAFRNQLIPAARRFKPDLILISAGFDAHREDPLAGMNLEDEDFEELTRMVMGIADEHCQSRLVSILEGGYNLNALARSAEAHLSVLSRPTQDV